MCISAPRVLVFGPPVAGGGCGCFLLIWATTRRDASWICSYSLGHNRTMNRLEEEADRRVVCRRDFGAYFGAYFCGNKPLLGEFNELKVAELVDAADSKSASFTRVWVRVPPLVPLWSFLCFQWLSQFVNKTNDMKNKTTKQGCASNSSNDGLKSPKFQRVKDSKGKPTRSLSPKLFKN